MALDLPTTVRASFSAGGEGEAIAFAGRWRSWGWLARSVDAVDALLGDAPGFGLIARNRPQHIAAFGASLASRRTISMIYAAQSPTGLAADIRTLRLPAILADAQDWNEATLAAAREVGTAAIAISDGEDAAGVRRLVPAGSGPFREIAEETAFELLSSGTTGAPKRLPLSWSAVTEAIDSTRSAYAGSTGDAPQILIHPIGNVAGLAYAAAPLTFGKRLVVLEKFEPHAWADAVRSYRPTRATLPPAGVQMLLDSDVSADMLTTLNLIAVGGGKLELEPHEAFETRFGIPILTAFGATEFGGVVANWTLDLYREWGAKKRGSAGQASSGGIALRAVDRETFAPLAPGEIGLLEAHVPRLGPDWIRTNDLAAIDADGFLFLHGRADAAINRGGFKIVPETVVAALRTHDAVADAAVVGLADRRLGEVPVAAVELRPGRSAAPDALVAYLKDRLVAYQVPAQILVVDALPRNASLKISLPDVKALFA